MSFLDVLTAKPWLPEPPPALARMPPTPAARVALRVLLAVIGVLFGLFLLAFLIRAQLPDWKSLATPGLPLASLAPLWLNTGLLLAASLALQLASVAARRDQAARLRRALAAGALFTLAFLFGQGWLWRLFIEMGHFVASNPAASFFYLLTGAHGLHLAGGLIAWGRVFVRATRGVAPAHLHLAVQMCAHYWHFLFVVWIVMFALLASPPQTLRMLAEICGIR